MRADSEEREVLRKDVIYCGKAVRPRRTAMKRRVHSREFKLEVAQKARQWREAACPGLPRAGLSQ